MPVSFKFVDRETKEAASIADIDNAIAAFEGVTPHDDYAYLFDKYGWIGIAVLMHSGGTVIDKAGLDNFLANTDVDFSQVERDCMNRFYLTDYEFHAWR